MPPEPESPPPPPAPRHTPVLPRETIDLLSPKPGETALDLTAGRGGHAVLLARAIGAGGTLILNDLDPANLEAAGGRVKAEIPAPDRPRLIPLHGSFAAAPRRLAEQGLSAGVVLADLGFESGQIEDAARGLAFSRDGPLDMRYDQSRGPTAADLIATLSERELAEILRDYGEEPAARRIAQKLVQERAKGPIQTTFRLAELTRAAIGSSRAGKIDAATRTFQALRIAVNDELSALEALLEHIGRAARALRLPGGRDAGRSGWLAPGARVGIISFHSLEDRRVKQGFASLAEQHAGTLLTERPVTPEEQEAATNPRSRSARLRVIRIGD